MLESKIVVTCNPLEWEGDFRLFEALACGALVFVDKMSNPAVESLRDNDHLVYYDRDDMPGLVKKLKYYLGNENARKQVSDNGYRQAQENFKPADLIRRILGQLIGK